MKVKKALALFLCLLCLGILFSCKIKTNNGNTNAGQNADTKKDYIYNETSEITLVIPDGQLSDENRKLFTDTLYPYKIYSVSNGKSEPAEHEIIFGESDRELSKKAYRLLERQEKKKNE